MERLCKKRVTQIQALKLVDDRMRREYLEFISTNTLQNKIIRFELCFNIEPGSVMADVHCETIGKLKKTKK